MFLGDILVAHGFVTTQDVMAGLDRQTRHGGRLGENLVALGCISTDQLVHALSAVPSSPRDLSQVGLELMPMLDLLARSMHSGAVDTATKLADLLKLPTRLCAELIKEAEQRQLVEAHGKISALSGAELRYSLTTKGHEWAQAALGRSSYVGPAPVPLDAFVARIRRQRISGERVPPEAVRAVLSDLTMADQLMAQIGPAVNSGHSMLLYGPPGNGKTSVAERIGRVFQDVVYIPHCFEVGDQIIRVFDPSLHREIPVNRQIQPSAANIVRDDFDHRWVACFRPFVITGGELTLDMLDLRYSPSAGFYEAPLHVKALNGVFLIDDFGRQLISPTELLNRWIVPLASRVDYLKLHTGKSFSLPFDELVIFSTNLLPSQLMDPAFLRRIPYKVEVGAPRVEDFRTIFHAAARAKGVTVTDEMIAYVIICLTERNDFPLASYQPSFLVEQIASYAKYLGQPPEASRELIDLAIGNLYTRDSPGFGVVSAVEDAGGLLPRSRVSVQSGA